MTVHPDRLALIEQITLAAGAHASLEQGACVMEAVAFVAGDPWSDHPQCASSVIAAFLRSLNDSLPDTDRQLLKPLIPRLVATAASPSVERQRAYLCADWACRVIAPLGLRVRGLDQQATTLEALAPITNGRTARAARGVATAAAAGASAAAYAAASAAASATYVADSVAAAYAAASAAASAARACAWSQVLPLALDLVERLIACGQETQP